MKAIEWRESRRGRENSGDEGDAGDGLMEIRGETMKHKGKK